MINRRPRVLFAISDTGAGHRSGAVAVEAALQLRAGADVEHRIADLLVDSGVPLVRTAPALYNNLTLHWLPLYDTLFELTDGRRRIDAVMGPICLSAQRRLARLLDAFQPDLLVALHPLASRLASSVRRARRLSFRSILVVTELARLHAAWADPSVDLCIVPTVEAYRRQRQLGISAERLVRAGFPIHPKFASCTASRAAARAMLGLEQQPFTLLLTGGGAGSGNMRKLARAIHQHFPEVQLLLVGGRNTTLLAQLRSLGLGPRAHIYGFVDNMEQLMAASDLVVTKAGPGTIMEALVLRRPVIITGAVGAQEQGNIAFAIDYQIGRYCPTIDQVLAAIAAFQHADTYAAALRNLPDPAPYDGALRIADVLLEQIAVANATSLPAADPLDGRWPATR